MARFPASWLDELRSRADIVQVVSGYTPLKRNGHRYWGLCPFHNEKTASFSVDPEQQLYYCFGCKAGGSVIQFVMDIEHLDFAEAVKHLADQLHMPLPQMEDDPDYQRRRDQRDRLLAANREAARFYHQTLFTPDGQPMLDYLKRRGLSDNIIRKFGLGAAPNAWDTLTRHLLAQGYTEEELRLCGLTVVKEAEPATEDRPARPRRAFDMFRNRAIFPIIDQYGNVLAFGGRTLGDGQPKYLNTSDTPVFNKRQGVYAANLLRKERHLERVILVEGYMDVVSLTQYGVTGVCATLGTALTSEQARLLKRFAPRVYLSYDGDSAGQHATLRGLDILEAEGIPARVLDFPDGLDPDEFIRRDGLQGFEQLPAPSPHRSVPRSADPAVDPAEERLLALLSTGRVPTDIASQEDFEDPLLKSLFVELSHGQSPAALVEAQALEKDRARVSQLLLSPVSAGSTDELLQMTKECLDSIRRRHIQQRIDALQQRITTLSGQARQEALAESIALIRQLNDLKY